VVDIRIGIADPVQRGSVTVSQNVDFGIVSAPKRDDGLQECRYVADPDRPVMSRSSNSTQLRLADPQGGCQFLTGAPQPGIIELQCDSASTVALQFAITNNSPNNRVQLQFSTRGDEFLTVGPAIIWTASRAKIVGLQARNATRKLGQPDPMFSIPIPYRTSWC
jgi:hypothetical protein